LHFSDDWLVQSASGLKITVDDGDELCSINHETRLRVVLVAHTSVNLLAQRVHDTRVYLHQTLHPRRPESPCVLMLMNTKSARWATSVKAFVPPIHPTQSSTDEEAKAAGGSRLRVRCPASRPAEDVGCIHDAYMRMHTLNEFRACDSALSPDRRRRRRSLLSCK
jgi:hypothetical protein